jgi:hypothetical protein
VDPNGDANGNGISNRIEYALSLNRPAPEGPGAPTVAKEGSVLAFTYRRLTGPGAPPSAIEKSDNLQTWTVVTPSETIVAINEDVETVRASVPVTGTRMFLRVRIGP